MSEILTDFIPYSLTSDFTPCASCSNHLICLTDSGPNHRTLTHYFCPTEFQKLTGVKGYVFITCDCKWGRKKNHKNVHGFYIFHQHFVSVEVSPPSLVFIHSILTQTLTPILFPKLVLCFTFISPCRPNTVTHYCLVYTRRWKVIENGY